MPSALLALLALFQQTAQVSAEVDREQVAVGDAVTLTIRSVVTTGASVQPVIPVFEGFSVIGRAERREPIGAGASGEVYVLELRLRAQRAGLWRLAAVRLELRDVALLAPEVEIAVESGGRPATPVLGPRVMSMLDRAQPPPAGDVAVTLVVSSDDVLVGEQIDVVTAAWFPRELLSRLRRPPTLRPPSVEGVYTAVQASTAGVAASRNVDGTWYDLWVAHQIVFPVSEGSVTIPPAGLAFTVPAGRQYFSEEKPYSLLSGTRDVRVRPLPRGGPGPVARGLAVGYELSPEPARAGEPIRVDLVLAGDGNTALWPRPTVVWPDGARGYAEAAGERARVRLGIVGGVRRFGFVVIADSAGSLALPEIRYDYFDPDAGWRTAIAPPVVLPVQPARTLDRQRPGPPLLEREPVALGWRQRWLAWVIGLLALMPPLVVGAARWRRGRRRPPVADPGRPGERLLARVRALVPDPERRRDGALEAALRETGLTARASADIARAYQVLAVRRFAPAAERDAPGAERDAARLLAGWPRRVRRGVMTGALMCLTWPAGLRAQSEADSLYHAERYSAAAALYYRDAVSSPGSARRWYAAGAAAWAGGQDARAASAWLTALRLAPRSREVRQAWTQVSRLSADLQRVGWVPPATPAELALLAAVIWSAGWLVLGVGRRRLGVAVLALALVAGAGAIGLRRQQRRPVGVLARAVQLRDVPHGLADETARAEVLAVVDVLEQRGGWRLVRAAGGARGWIPASALAEVRGLDSGP